MPRPDGLTLNCRQCAERGQTQRLVAVINHEARGIDLRCSKHGRVVLLTPAAVEHLLLGDHVCEVCGKSGGGCGHGLVS